MRTVKITGKYGIILYEVDIMVVKEYGKTNKDTIILLHGGGLSWWNYEEVAELLKDEYHIILPILDGHAGSDNDWKNTLQLLYIFGFLHVFVECPRLCLWIFSRI